MPVLTPRRSGFPVVGDYLEFRRNPLEFWTEVGRQGPAAEVRFGTQRFLVVTDPVIAEHVLLTHVRDYPRDRRLMRLNRGPGPELMFNTDDWELWRTRRRMLQPMFHRDVISSFSRSIVSAGEEAADRWLDAGTIDLQTELRALTMGIILRTMFSIDDPGETDRLQESFEVSSEVVSARAAAPIPIPWWLPTPTNLRLRDLTRYRWGVLAELIRSRMSSGEAKGDLLDLLLDQMASDPDRLGITDLVGEMSGIVFAGHETTAETLTWLLYEVSRAPDLAEALAAEAGGVSQDATDPDRTPLTRRVIDETLRLYPAVFLTIREADADHTVAGVEIPRGTRLVINIRGMHRDPAAWPDPDRFDPDRFAGGGSPDRHRFQFIPFLAGPKKCLGDRLAIQEMALLVPTLMRRLRFAYAGDSPPVATAGFTLKTVGGMPMRVTAR